MSRLLIAVIVLCGVPLGNGITAIDSAERTLIVGGDEREQAIRRLESALQHYDTNDWQARKELVARLANLEGEALLPGIVAVLEDRHPLWEAAVALIGELRERARAAVPVALQLLDDAELPEPIGWNASYSKRHGLVQRVQTWTFAASDVGPALLRRMLDRSEDPELRDRVLHALKRDLREELGPWFDEQVVPAARVVLQNVGDDDQLQSCAAKILSEAGDWKFLEGQVESEDDGVRAAVHRLLAGRDRTSSEQHFTDLILADPADPNIAAYFGGRGSLQHEIGSDPLRAATKQKLREKLQVEPDARAAWALAKLIHAELAGTALAWAFVTKDFHDSQIFVPRPRRDPSEHYGTYRVALEKCYEFASGSALGLEAATILARLALMQGDWEAMNEWLFRTGRRRVDLEQRSLFHAPPSDWRDLASHWGPCAESLRSGTCSLQLHVEKDGAGVRGVHFLLAPWTPPNEYSSGVKIDTLFHHPEPVRQNALGEGAFGYQADWNRTQTRYAVSDEQGDVLFSQLPEGSWKLEVLVLPANFEEFGREYQLCVRTDTGTHPVGYGLGMGEELRPVTRADSVVELPVLEIRSTLRFEQESGVEIDPRHFTLRWTRRANSPPERTQVLCMAVLGDPYATLSGDECLRFEETIGPVEFFDVGGSGVSGAKLVAGNWYRFEVFEKDASGAVVDRVGPVFVRVPWRHRESHWEAGTPLPWSRAWLGPKEDEPSRFAAALRHYLSEHPNCFAREYAELALAWTDWQRSELDTAAHSLTALRDLTDPGNLVHDTAERWLSSIASGAPPPERILLTPEQ